MKQLLILLLISQYATAQVTISQQRIETHPIYRPLNPVEEVRYKLPVLSDSAVKKRAKDSVPIAQRNSFTWIHPLYPATDTLPCLFLEVVDMDNALTVMRSGFIVRKAGQISFGRMSVSPEYLPITSGFVTSDLFDSKMNPIKVNAIKIIIKPIKINHETANLSIAH